jgi:oligogalacturonide transporter
VPNQPQSPQTLFYLKYVFVFVPIILIITGIVFSYKYKVTPEKQKILIQEIKRIKKGGKKENADPAVKEVCEELTGIKYR